MSGDVLLIFLDHKWLLVTKTSDVTTDSIYSLFQDHTTREKRRWDTNPAFGFLHIPPGVFCPVKEMKPRHAVLIATKWEANRQPVHPRTSAQPVRG